MNFREAEVVSNLKTPYVNDLVCNMWIADYQWFKKVIDRYREDRINRESFIGLWSSLQESRNTEWVELEDFQSMKVVQYTIKKNKYIDYWKNWWRINQNDKEDCYAFGFYSSREYCFLK